MASQTTDVSQIGKIMNRFALQGQGALLPLQQQSIGTLSNYLRPSFSLGGFSNAPFSSTSGGSFGGISPLSLTNAQIKAFSRFNPQQVETLQRFTPPGMEFLPSGMTPNMIKTFGKLGTEQLGTLGKLFGFDTSGLTGAPVGGKGKGKGKGTTNIFQPNEPVQTLNGGQPAPSTLASSPFSGPTVDPSNPLSRVAFGSPEEAIAAQYLQGLTDINALTGAAGKTLSDIVSPGIEAKLIAMGMGRGGALPELLAQEGTRMALPLLQEQRGATANLAQYLDALMGRRLGIAQAGSRPGGAPFQPKTTVSSGGSGGIGDFLAPLLGKLPGAAFDFFKGSPSSGGQGKLDPSTLETLAPAALNLATSFFGG